MAWSYLLDVTIASIRLRIAETGSGLVLTKVCPGETQGSLRIRRVRFASSDIASVGPHCLTEALDAVEPVVRDLRVAAERSARRAVAAKRTMRAASSGLRALELDCVNSTELYLREGRRMATECALVEQSLDAAGFPTGVRPTPAWIEQLLNAEEATFQDRKIEVGPVIRE